MKTWRFTARMHVHAMTKEETMMTTQSDIPFALYKANLQLALRTNKLLKECGQRWLDTFEHAIDDNVAETQQDIDKLSLGEDWQSLAAIPGDTLLRLLQQGVGDTQAVTQAAVTNQTKFLTGLQDAFLLWQRETSKALGGGETAKPYDAMLGDFFKLFTGTSGTGASHG